MALRGFKVVEFAGLAPAPFCGVILRDHGASVIRIDKPNTIPYTDSLGRGKRSIGLDIRKTTSNKILTKICSNADVLIDPFRPGILEKYKLGPSELCKLNPRLIYARLTGFGQSGPFSKMAGHDINYIAISGVLSALGGKKPHHPVNLMGDFAGGGLVCALGICLALLERQNSGKGQVIDANMVEGSAYVSSWLWTTRSKKFPLPMWTGPRGSNLLDGGTHFYQTYETKDGKFMSVGALEPQFYEAFIKGLGLNPDDHPQSLGDCDDMKKLCAEIFLSKTQDEWCGVFDFTDSCVAPVLQLEEAHLHKHNAANESFARVQDGEVVPIPAPRLSRTPGRVCPEEPVPGQHTREILSELGFSESDVGALLEQEVVYESDIKASL